jgi:hypothetical protein
MMRGAFFCMQFLAGGMNNLPEKVRFPYPASILLNSGHSHGFKPFDYPPICLKPIFHSATYPS